ncbi:hypothetical protein EJ03DRAFT_248168, partial [Teratosphaeria nubilosa]
ALAGVHLNAAMAEQGTSSDDDVPEAQHIPPEDARTAIGLSIGLQQTRLASPRTPAVEKAAAIDGQGGFFGGFDSTNDVLNGEAAEAEEDEPPPQAPAQQAEHTRRKTIPAHSPRKAEVRLPSPWRARVEPTKRSDRTRSLLKDGFFSTRKRSSSGPESRSQAWHKSLMSSLPSMPKHFSLTSSFSSQNASNPSIRHKPSESRVASSANARSLSPTEREEASATVGDLPARPQIERLQSRQSQLRRSASDSSLTPHRTLSRVSSLGDDSRWEDVHEQVNSRLKAIKDSWQDSSIKLPSLPSIASIRSEFLRERSNSVSGRKQSDPEPPIDPMTRRPYHSAKMAIADSGANRPAQHPHFNQAVEQLEGDIVILGGYRGSILRSAEPPHRQVWVPIKVGLNIRKVDLEVGLEEDADERATEKIIPGGMLTHIGPVDISRRLFKRLRSCENAKLGKLRVHDYGYDWRLHPDYLSKQLIKFLEGLYSNKPGTPKEHRGATVIAHSLGGLITRHAVNHRPDLFRGVIYAGVPNTCVNILGPLRNGDEVLLSSRVLTAQVNFTIRTSFALLPLNGRCFIDKNTKEEYVVDFFNPQTWIDYRLSPCVARPLPPLTPQPKPTGLTSYVTSVTSSLPSLPLPGRRAKSPSDPKPTASAATEPDTMTPASTTTTLLNNSSTIDPTPDPRTAVTIPHPQALDYLTRTLARVKQFKQDLAFIPAHAEHNLYPPIAVIYGKSTPTVYGAKVDGRDGIKHADAYEALAFASGDGVVLARAAMVPEGYACVRGGVVSSERGHVTLLGDLEALGRCLDAVAGARARGV